MSVSKRTQQRSVVFRDAVDMVLAQDQMVLYLKVNVNVNDLTGMYYTQSITTHTHTKLLLLLHRL
jgi:hypothetical protein